MGTDHFAELGAERRLTWKADDLRARYDERCRAVHPDRGGRAEDFQRVQAAYAVLASPGGRLRHWLELGGYPADDGGGGLDPEVSALFSELGPMLQRAEEAAKKRGEARSALARSMSERESYALMPELETARETVRSLLERLTARFEEFELAGPAESAAEGGRVARSLRFLEKWDRQLMGAWSKLGGW